MRPWHRVTGDRCDSVDGAGWEYVHVVNDDHSRIAFMAIYPDGVRYATPAVRAERLCSEAVFVPPDFPRYKAVSREVREIFQRHADQIEPLDLGAAYEQRLPLSDEDCALRERPAAPSANVRQHTAGKPE